MGMPKRSLGKSSKRSIHGKELRDLSRIHDVGLGEAQKSLEESLRGALMEESLKSSIGTTRQA